MENPENMEYTETTEEKGESRKSARLPYILGGAPGALVAFAGLEAFASAAMCVLYLMTVLRVGGLGNILTLCFSIAGMVLAFKLWTGLRRLHKGSYGGADTATEAVTGRRIMLWVGFSAIMVMLIIGMIRAGGAGLIVFIVVAVVGLLILLPINFYYKKAGEILGHVKYESTTGKPVRPEKFESFSVWSIIFAVLLLFTVLLYMFGPYVFEKFEDGGFFRDQISADVYDLYVRYRNLTLLGLYIAGARCLVNNICFRGFMRSHRDGGGETLGPTGLENSYGICVLGSILFGWVALSGVTGWLSNLDYIREHEKYMSEETRLLYSQITSSQVLLIAGAVLFAVALMLRKGRTVPGVLGAAATIAGCVFSIIRYTADSDASEALKEKYAMYNVSDYLTIAFCTILAIALVIRLSRRVPKAVPIFLMILAVIAGILAFAARLPKAGRSGFNPDQILSIINNLVFYCGVRMLAMFGAAWLVRTPRAEKKDSMAAA